MEPSAAAQHSRRLFEDTRKYPTGGACAGYRIMSKLRQVARALDQAEHYPTCGHSTYLRSTVAIFVRSRS